MPVGAVQSPRAIRTVRQAYYAHATHAIAPERLPAPQIPE